jgi:hypothetical protein
MIKMKRQVQGFRRVGLNRTFRHAIAAMSMVTLAAAVLMLGGCATNSGNPSTPENPADIIGQPADYTTLAAPPADKALVCFFRPSSVVGMAVPWFFIESEKILCTLPNGTYYSLLMTPGTHTFSCKPGPGARYVPKTMELQGGKIYCLRGVLGGLSGRIALQSPEKANALTSKLKFRKQRGD